MTTFVHAANLCHDADAHEDAVVVVRKDQVLVVDVQARLQVQEQRGRNRRLIRRRCWNNEALHVVATVAVCDCVLICLLHFLEDSASIPDGTLTLDHMQRAFFINNYAINLLGMS